MGNNERGPGDFTNQEDTEERKYSAERARLQRQEDRVFELEMGWQDESQ